MLYPIIGSLSSFSSSAKFYIYSTYLAKFLNDDDLYVVNDVL